MAYEKIFEDTFTGTGPITGHAPDLTPFATTYFRSNGNGTPALDGSGNLYDSENQNFQMQVERENSGAKANLASSTPFAIEVEFLKFATTSGSDAMSFETSGPDNAGLSISWIPHTGAVKVGYRDSSGFLSDNSFSISTGATSLALAARAEAGVIYLTGDITTSFVPGSGLSQPVDWRFCRYSLIKGTKISRVAVIADVLSLQLPLFSDEFAGSGSLADHTPDNAVGFPGFDWTGTGLQVNGSGVGTGSYLNTVAEDGTWQEAIATFDPVPIGALTIELGVANSNFYSSSDAPQWEVILTTEEGGYFKFTYCVQNFGSGDFIQWNVEGESPDASAYLFAGFNYSGTYGSFEPQYLKLTLADGAGLAKFKGGFFMTPDGAEQTGYGPYGDMSWFNNIASVKIRMRSGVNGNINADYLLLSNVPAVDTPDEDPDIILLGLSSVILAAPKVRNQILFPVGPTPRVQNTVGLRADLSDVASTAKVVKQVLLPIQIKDQVTKSISLSAPMLATSKVQAQFDLHWLLAPGSQFITHTPPHITL